MLKLDINDESFDIPEVISENESLIFQQNQGVT